MDRQKIIEELGKHTPEELQAISDYCRNTQAKRHLSMYSLGKAIARKFNLPDIAGIKLANAFNRYMI